MASEYRYSGNKQLLRLGAREAKQSSLCSRGCRFFYREKEGMTVILRSRNFVLHSRDDIVL